MQIVGAFSIYVFQTSFMNFTINTANAVVSTHGKIT